MFFQAREYGIVQRFHGGYDEEATGLSQDGQEIDVFAEMLNLYGGVVGDLRKFAMKGFDNGNGMTDRIEKIGIAKSDMLRPRGYLLANTRQHDFRVNQSKRAVVDGNDGTVAAVMFAAAAGFGVADGTMFAAGKNEMRVGF